jgi:GTPase KRas protein
MVSFEPKTTSFEISKYHRNNMALPQYKLVVLGPAGVGKSALTIQLINHQFMEVYDPTIEDSYRKQVEIDGEACQLEVLDTAGQEDDFGNGGIEQYVRRAQGCLVVFAIDSRVSFQEVSSFRERMVKANGKVFMVLVGNKCDLAHQREVPAPEAAELAKSFGCEYLETSAKSRINVDEAFFELVREIRKPDQDKGSKDHDKHKCSLS